MKVDFIMLWGYRGGVENVVNITSMYLANRNWDVRVIQLSWEGYSWVDSLIPFFPLTTGATGHDTDELIKLLTCFWAENGMCDIALGVGSPIVTYIAKQAEHRLIEQNRLNSAFPVVSWMHADPAEYERCGLGNGWMLGYADAFLTINHQIENYILKYVSDAKIFHVKNPVTPDVYDEKKTEFREAATKGKNLLFIGRLSPEKGLDTILQALTKLGCDSWSLDIVGAGEEEYEEDLHKIVYDKGLENRVFFHGWKEKPWLIDYHADALILASKHEASPLTVLEALANGIPVIATPVGSIPDTIIPGKNGYLFPVDNADNLSQILHFWSLGKLPEIRKEDCLTSVEDHLYHNAMQVFEASLTDIAHRLKQSEILLDIVIAVADQGGVEQIINSFARYLGERSIRVRVVQMVWEHHPWTVPEIEFHYIYDNRNDQSVQSFATGYQRFLEQHERPDLILATAWPVMVMAARMAVQKLGLNIRIASWLHAPLSRYRAAGYGDENQLKYADIHFAISREIVEEISSLLPGAYVYRIYNPFDRSKLRDIGRGDGKTILFVGRLSEEKNISLILTALHKVMNDGWKLRLVGDGPERECLEKMAFAMGLSECVQFDGWTDDPWLTIDEAALLVVSSYYEGGSLVALEALACGIPVAGTPVGYLPEVIEPGVNGWLFENGDADMLGQILHCLATGALEMPSPQVCRQSVALYEKDHAFDDFMRKIVATCQDKILVEELFCP